MPQILPVAELDALALAIAERADGISVDMLEREFPSCPGDRYNADWRAGFGTQECAPREMGRRDVNTGPCHHRQPTPVMTPGQPHQATGRAFHYRGKVPSCASLSTAGCQNAHRSAIGGSSWTTTNRQALAATSAVIKPLVRMSVATDDMDNFVAVALNEPLQLHEGNIGRSCATLRVRSAGIKEQHVIVGP